MKITALTENTSACGFPVEHGLSLYIETGGRVILFDMGQTALFAENAARLGIDLGRVDLAVLSHGHYDHSGGLRRFLELNDCAPVWLHRRAFEPHFNAEGKTIGMDESLAGSDRLRFAEGETHIGDGLTLFDANDREKAVDLGAFGLTMRQGGRLLPDDFAHEHYLLIEENGRRVLISGCSHKGVLNLAAWFRPDVLVGGFHFFHLPIDDVLRGYARTLAAYDADFYTCHCTGREQFDAMQPLMPRLHYLSAGDTVEI